MRLLFGILALLAIAIATVAIVVFIGVKMSKTGRRHGTSGSLGNAMLDLQSMIEPGKKNVIEAQRKRAETEEEDESGDPPIR